jgi:hypothetical protein
MGSIQEFEKELMRFWEINGRTWWQQIAVSRHPDYVIGPEDDPYLMRWWVIPRNRFFNVYLHCFLRSDTDEALHDHPWWNVSRLLRGKYIEHTFSGWKEYNEGDMRFRTAKEAHRVELHAGPAWSLFITGPKLRTWGFHCPKGWKPWTEFVEQRDGGNSRGAGCGEP